MKYHLELDKHKYKLQLNLSYLILRDIMTHKGDLPYSAFQHQSAGREMDYPYSPLIFYIDILHFSTNQNRTFLLNMLCSCT